MRKSFLPLFALLLSTFCARAEQVVFSEIMYNPPGTKPEFIEIWNITHTPLDMAKWRFTDGVQYELPDFSAGDPQAHFLKPLERIVVSSATPAVARAAYGIPENVRVFGPWTGALDNAGEQVTLSDKNGVLLCTVNYQDGGRWPRAADGPGHSLVLANENRHIDDFRVWRASNFAGGTPGVPEYSDQDPFPNPEVGVGQGATVINYDDVWKYTAPLSDPGTAWRGLAFDDSSWASGPGLIGFENSPLPPPGLQTELPNEGRPVYLFRRTFTYNGTPAGATYSIDQIIDDGVSYYLNGQLLGSVRHTPGVWNNTNGPVVSNAAEELNALSGAATGLVNGTNVLTAEVHQSGTDSSDMVFGARFKLSTPASITINEVLPGGAGQGFVEFFNATAAPINLNGHYLSDDQANLTKHQITTDLIVPANSFATIGFAEAQLSTGATTTVILTQPDGVTTLNAIVAQIPADGRSLGRMPAGAATWYLFVSPTPNAPNVATADLAGQLRLNEAFFTANAVTWVELQNLANAPNSVAGLYLASRADLSDKVALTGAVPANGYASWDVNFPADGGGDITLYLIDSGNNVLGAAELKRVPGRDSVQALYPTVPAAAPSWDYIRTTPDWYASSEHTRNAANNPARTADIVISEIMYDPPSRGEAGEYIELYNKGAAAVSLAGWKLRSGVDFDFPANATIPAGGYLVVASNAAFIQEAYGAVPVVGNWSGKLSNSGDLIRLLDSFGNLADEVDYRAGGDWPELAAGKGSSIELIHPSMDNNRASAWRASDESNKTSFQTYTVSGTYLQMNSAGTPTDYKELHFFLTGDAYVQLRNITFRQNGTGANVITNGTTHALDGSSASGWLMQGTHWASHIDGGGVMHLISDGHGDNRPNRAEIDCTALTQGGNYTLQFEARWVNGKPRLVAQTWDHSIGKPFLLPIPNNLGTPGAANSTALANPAPQVDSILHSPAVPKAADPVRVTARVTSAAPLSAVAVVHREDDVNNSNPWQTTPMFDDGTNGDAVANDGVYTATITQHQTNNRIVQFYVRATAGNGLSSQLPRQGEGRPALWIVDNRNLNSSMRRHRFVISAYDRDALNTSSGQSPKFEYDFPRLSNHYFNATFIHNDSDVYYHAEIRKAGSPWTRSDGASLDRGKWKVPGDRIFRNRYKSTFDNDAGGGARHHNRLTRYWLYLFGHAANENEYVYYVINSDGQSLREDVEPVANDMLNRNFENGNDGQLMRSDDEWWFQDNWGRTSRNADWSYKGTDATIRYHTEWMARTREEVYDYSTLIEFFKTVSNSNSSEALLNRVLDPKLTLMMAAVRGYIDDWDSLTLARGKNGFFYRKPTDGRWMFLHWDSDLAFGNANGAVTGNLAGWGTYINKPWTRRIFNYYLTEMLNNYTKNSARISAWFDAEEASSSAYTVNKTFYENWFTNREGRIRQEINNAGGQDPFTAPFSVSTAGGGTTSAAILSPIMGVAPSSVWTVVVQNQPNAVFTWLNQTQWTISGIVLQSGLNTITLNALDEQGNVIATTSYTITKTGNAPPVMALRADPASWNARLGNSIALSAAASYDPDGDPLAFAWSSSPTAGVTLTSVNASARSAVFNTPGIYSFTVTGSDLAGGSEPITREVLAYNTADFSPMNDKLLEPHWLLQNVDNRDNFSGSAWYSTLDKPGQLLVQVLDDSAKPAAFPSATHPLITRTLPAATDFALQTDLALEARQTGNFFTGLVVDVTESGIAVRYLFGIENGTQLTVKRSSGGAFTNLAQQTLSTGAEVLRIRRIGNQLIFQRRGSDDAWLTPLRTQTLAAGTTANRGGVFVSTTAAESVRVAFDYIVLADPANTTALLDSLRLTEIMYHPAAPSTVEFIELQNVGAEAVNLQGVRFENNTPVAEFVFGDETLASGEFIVVTNDIAAFRAVYGAGPRLAGAWSSGALNNAGEQVVLRDAQGNLIHNFIYDDEAPWPVEADGAGPSIEVIDVAGNYSDGTNWRASAQAGGTPGREGIGPDSDGDGIPDSIEEMFGTDPHDASSKPRATMSSDSGGQSVITWPSVAGRSYRIEYRDNLDAGSWETLATVSGVAGSSSFTDPANPPPEQRFYRVVALP